MLGSVRIVPEQARGSADIYAMKSFSWRWQDTFPYDGIVQNCFAAFFQPLPSIREENKVFHKLFRKCGIKATAWRIAINVNEIYVDLSSCLSEEKKWEKNWDEDQAKADTETRWKWVNSKDGYCSFVSGARSEISSVGPNRPLSDRRKDNGAKPKKTRQIRKVLFTCPSSCNLFLLLYLTNKAVPGFHYQKAAEQLVVEEEKYSDSLAERYVIRTNQCREPNWFDCFKE